MDLCSLLCVCVCVCVYVCVCVCLCVIVVPSIYPAVLQNAVNTAMLSPEQLNALSSDVVNMFCAEDESVSGAHTQTCTMSGTYLSLHYLVRVCAAGLCV